MIISKYFDKLKAFKVQIYNHSCKHAGTRNDDFFFKGFNLVPNKSCVFSIKILKNIIVLWLLLLKCKIGVPIA